MPERQKIQTMLWPIISAILLTLSYPVFNLEFLAWFAFVPFFFAIKDKSHKKAFRFGFLFGLIFFASTIYWLLYVSVLGYIILILYLSIFFALFAALVQSAIHRSRPTSVFLIPLVWILLEYLRANLFTGFGWALLGYSQYLNLPVIQIADKTGVWGVSFIVMMVNVAIFKLLKDGIRKSRLSLTSAILILALSIYYGHVKLNEKALSMDLKISVIQGNIPQHQKWDVSFKEHILTRYESLTKEAAKEKPDLIIWPETSLPGYLEEKDLGGRVRRLARETGTLLLIGAPSIGDYENDEYYNSAILISAEGRVLNRYDKLRLVPFGEYVPFEKKFSFIRGLIDKPIGDFRPGTEYTVFRMDNGAAFSVLICFEDIFPDLVASFVKREADFLVNITNDAWFMKSSAPYQHAQASVFRAVENRVPVVRAANTGLSCFIDSKGRIIDKVSIGKEDIFVTGFKTSNIEIY